MSTSSGAHVYEAIVAITAAMAAEGISKSRENRQQGYRFRSVDDVYAAIGHHLAKNKLCMLPRVVERTTVDRPTKSGGNSTYTTLTVDFDLVSAVDGSSHTIRTVGEAMDQADKSSNKAMSAAFKYACFLAFQIPTEGDNDADAHHIEPAPPANDTGERPSIAEREIGAMFARATTPEEIAQADTAAMKAVAAKAILNGARARLLKLRATAIARVEGR